VHDLLERNEVSVAPIRNQKWTGVAAASRERAISPAAKKLLEIIKVEAPRHHQDRGVEDCDIRLKNASQLGSPPHDKAIRLAPSRLARPVRNWPQKLTCDPDGRAARPANREMLTTQLHSLPYLLTNSSKVHAKGDVRWN
jgi:hypothetical protein